MKVSYNWLKWYLPDLEKGLVQAGIPEAPDSDKLKDIITYHLTEVEGVGNMGGDTIFDINILPNRAHDLLSHQGIARELAGQLGIGYQDPTPKYKVPTSNPTNLKVNVSTEGCRRYMARMIRNVKVGPSPQWVVDHLASIGERSINNIVDATNIVMFDCGQPTHAFDLRTIPGEEVNIKDGKEEELKLVGRDEIVAKLNDNDIVISDKSGTTLALAGIKGGVNSGIADDTTEIVLEVANFDPVRVRKTARRIGVLSDAAKRFENDLSPELCDFAMMELSGLMMEMFPDAVFEDVVDVYNSKQEERTITFTTKMVNKKLGSNIADSDIEKILNDYGFKHSGNFEVVIPALRLDLVNVEDMIEEIGRIFGYDKVNPEMPKIDFTPKDNETYKKIQLIRSDLVAKGYKEVMTYTFTKKGDVQVARGLKGKDFLRTNLTDGLKESYEMNRLNAPVLDIDEVKIFEIGTVFKNGENVHVAYADQSGVKEMKLDDYLNSEIVSERSSDLLASTLGQTISYPISEFTSGAINFKMWSPYPFIVRDVSVWINSYDDPKVLENIYKNFGGELLLQSPRLVDKFEKDGKISYAYRLVFQSSERTLTDEEVSKVMDQINEEITKNSDWQIR